MKASSGIPCVLVNPSKASGLPLGGPVKLKVIAEIDGEKIDFVASPGGKPRSVTCEIFQNISTVKVEHFTVGAQRLAILRTSALRLGVMGGLFTLWRVFISQGETNSLGYYLVIIGVVVLGFLPFSFVLNGGLGIRDDIDRFSFFGQSGNRLFYMEVGEEQETVVVGALREAGVRMEGD